mmetsp:Transcript_46354/g.113734  ORF Transcript_46354/g.113734 Transcript_46354/m.113734 type:complete len:233 (+) Transcript_46354:728-1426(+)
MQPDHVRRSACALLMGARAPRPRAPVDLHVPAAVVLLGHLRRAARQECQHGGARTATLLHSQSAVRRHTAHGSDCLVGVARDPCALGPVRVRRALVADGDFHHGALRAFPCRVRGVAHLLDGARVLRRATRRGARRARALLPLRDAGARHGSNRRHCAHGYARHGCQRRLGRLHWRRFALRVLPGAHVHAGAHRHGARGATRHQRRRHDEVRRRGRRRGGSRRRQRRRRRRR